jgi:hypothetical protein
VTLSTTPPPPLPFAVASRRPAKLTGAAMGVGRIFPRHPVRIEHDDGSVVPIDPLQHPARFAPQRPPMVILSWPTELQDRTDIDVDAEPVGLRQTIDCATLRLDAMKQEHDCSQVGGLIAIENGRVSRREALGLPPEEGLDPMRDMRLDLAVIAIEGANGRKIFWSEGTWIPILVDGAQEATDPIDAARWARRERDRAREKGVPWQGDPSAFESGYHVREALRVSHDRFGRSWQSYLGPSRERLIEEAIVRNWDGRLVDPWRAVGAEPQPKDPGIEL